MRIYLDYNATSPMAPDAIEAMTAALPEFGNASSIHAFGQRAKAIVDDARAEVAALIDADPSEVVFTSGGTESDNFALRGAVEAVAAAGRRQVITTRIEHEAILTTATSLERHGTPITRVAIGASGVADPAAFRDAIDARAAIVSVMHANNEVGTIQPVAEIAVFAREHGALMHTDAVQSVGKIPVSVRALGVDLLSLSAHKFGGPKGIGALWIRRGVRLAPYLTGGKQERNRRAGTENVPAIAGLGAAARAAREHLKGYATTIADLRDRLEAGVLGGVTGTAVNGDPTRRVPNTSNISFEGVEAESLLIALDLEGVAVSTGSACSSGSLEPSHVLKAMGFSGGRTRNSLRFSLGPATTVEEVDRVIAILPALVAKLRQLTRTAAALR